MFALYIRLRPVRGRARFVCAEGRAQFGEDCSFKLRTKLLWNPVSLKQLVVYSARDSRARLVSDRHGFCPVCEPIYNCENKLRI